MFPVISYRRSPVWILSIFHYYIGWISFIVYPYILIKMRQKLPVFDWCILIFICMWSLLGVYFNDLESTAKSIRFFWGFFFFYLYFRKVGEDINLNSFLSPEISLIVKFESKDPILGVKKLK